MKTIFDKLNKKTLIFLLVIFLLLIILTPFILTKTADAIIYYSRMRCPGTEVIVYVRDQAECTKYYTR